MEASGCNIDTLIPIIGEKEFEIATYVTGYHDYKNIWKPAMKEKLETRMEPDNIMDKFTTAIVKSEEDSGGAHNERKNWKIRKCDLLLLERKHES